ncbi:MAG: 4-(cytidine 5'-diphospho)-2-C-methyl-D-erythritol kinase [Alphaproteobacteria bacterium]
MTYLQKVCVFAPAKINLFLHITGRRHDGYHTLHSLVAFADCGDIIDIEPAAQFGFSVHGPFAPVLEGVGAGAGGDGNIVIKAAKELAQIVGKPLDLHIRLTKNLPVAAGLGGGSCDAAATLWGLQDYWGLNHNTPYLLPLMTRLGADVAMCLRCQPQIVRGIGEELYPAPLMPEIPIVLVNPLRPCLTQDVFLQSTNRAYREDVFVPAGFSNALELAAFLQNQHNDLYDGALALVPEINSVMSALEAHKECLLARMCGSGASCFGLFETIKDAKKVAKIISKNNPGWWVQTAWLNRPERS